MFGTNQSGINDLRIANIFDEKLLKTTSDWATIILDNEKTYVNLLRPFKDSVELVHLS